MESRKPITLTPTTASYYWLLGAFVLWTLAGLFPFELTFEGDSLRIIAGCSVMYNQGWAVPPEVSYQYGMQPAIIYLIVSVKHLLPFLSCNTIYSMLSAIAALAAIPLAVAFVHRVTGMSKTLILFALILLPETYALSTYPNSSSFSYALALWAFLLIMREAPFWQPLTIMSSFSSSIGVRVSRKALSCRWWQPLLSLCSCWRHTPCSKPTRSRPFRQQRQ